MKAKLTRYDPDENSVVFNENQRILGYTNQKDGNYLLMRMDYDGERWNIQNIAEPLIEIVKENGIFQLTSSESIELNSGDFIRFINRRRDPRALWFDEID